MKVFLLYFWDYDNSHIIGAFSSREKAAAAMMASIAEDGSGYDEMLGIVTSEDYWIEEIEVQ